MWLWPQVLINGSLYRRICIINCVHQQPRSTEEQPTNTPRYFDKHIPPTPLFLPSSLDPCPSPTSTLWPSVSLTPSSSPASQSPTSLANSCAFLVFAQATQPSSSHQTPIQLPRSTGVKMQFLKTVAVFLFAAFAMVSLLADFILVTSYFRGSPKRLHPLRITSSSSCPIIPANPRRLRQH